MHGHFVDLLLAFPLRGKGLAVSRASYEGGNALHPDWSLTTGPTSRLYMVMRRIVICPIAAGSGDRHSPVTEATPQNAQKPAGFHHGGLFDIEKLVAGAGFEPAAFRL